MRVLLTGGTGMLGKAIRIAFSERWPAAVLDVPSRSDLDVSDYRESRSFIADGAYDVAIHAAARVGGIAANIAEPVEFLYDNVLGNTQFIKAAADVGLPRLIFLGSSCMYPKDLGGPLKEADILTGPLEPTNEGYALAKIVGSKLCEYVTRERNLCYCTIIPPNLYGPHDNFSEERSHLVAAAIRKVHQARERDDAPVVIWGDGSARREFMYVSDLARLVVGLLDRVESLPAVLNVGVSADHTVDDYYQQVAEVVGYEGAFVHDLTKPAGMKRKLLDSGKAKALGLQPMTDLATGLRATYEFFLNSYEGASDASISARG